MPVLTYRINTSANDCEDNSGANAFTAASPVRVGKYIFGLLQTQNCGFRFVLTALPQNASILSASLTVNRAAVSGTPDFRIYADMQDNAPAWGANESPFNITQSTASLRVNSTSSGLNTFNVTEVVREWYATHYTAKGNAIRLAMLNIVGSPTNYVDWTSYDGDPDLAAALAISYAPAITARYTRPSLAPTRRRFFTLR